MLKHLPRGSTGVHHPISLRVDARDAARSTRAVAPTNTASLKRRARALAFLHSHTARRRQAHHRLTCGRLSERRSAAPSTAAQSARSPPLRRPRRSRPCRRSQRRRKRGLSRHDRMSTWPRAPTVWNSEWRYAPNLGFSAPGTSQGPPRTSPDRSRADPEQTKPKSFRPRGRTRRRDTMVQAYFLLKPPGDATPFLASSLELRRRARGYCRVQGGGGCDGLVTQSEKTVSWLAQLLTRSTWYSNEVQGVTAR